MFCTTLRKRKQWAPAVPGLLQFDKMRFRESKLDTHDVNLPLPSISPGQRYLRFVLLSNTDGDSAYKHQRVERLYHLSAGSDTAIIWLFGDNGDGPLSYAQFQIELTDKFDIPLVPLQSIEDLPLVLSRFHRAFLKADLFTRQTRAQPTSTGPIEALLPYSTVSPPLSEHKVHILSDVTVSFADLVNMVSSKEGRAEVARYLEQGDADRIIEFWSRECFFHQGYK
ncbi:hypothetical protein BD289DRAFT_188934 [Coniella lustricola]|uniref:Uncharacterized protein n=1 Tax=Coniella lustricola TaxID=2025994 RepID=A0A2T3ACV4_9PEZI|nr:hypothetical protein BD289DRAFT_188934 [Coniella lustricola]